MKLNEIQNHPNWYLIHNFLKAMLFEQFNDNHIASWELTDTKDNSIDIEVYAYQVILPHLLEHRYACIYLQKDDTDHPRIDLEEATNHHELLSKYPIEDYDGDLTEGNTTVTDINGTFYTVTFIID